MTNAVITKKTSRENPKNSTQKITDNRTSNGTNADDGHSKNLTAKKSPRDNSTGAANVGAIYAMPFHTNDSERQEMVKIEPIVQEYMEKMKKVKKYVLAPPKWMLEMMNKICNRMAFRKDLYLRDKRELLQLFLLTASSFSISTAYLDPEAETHEETCNMGRQLYHVLVMIIKKVRSAHDEFYKMVTILRKRLYYHFVEGNTWREQDGADMQAICTLLAQSPKMIDEQAEKMEQQWTAVFIEEIAGMTNSCHLGGKGVGIYDQIGWIWPKLHDHDDQPLDEDAMFAPFFPDNN